MKSKKQRRWARGELTTAVTRALGKRPQTIREISQKVKASPNSVYQALRAGVGRAAGSRAGGQHRPSTVYVRA